MNPTLLISAPGPHARRGEPLSVGIPLPSGWCTDPATLSVLDENGVAIPAQASPLVRWGNGSIRWALLDIRLDIPSGGECRCTLVRSERGQGRGVPTPVCVTLDGRRATIETGAAFFTLGADGELTYRGHEGRATGATATFHLRAPEAGTLSPDGGRLAVELSGPIRTVLRVDAPIGGTALQLCARYHFVAGTSTVRVEATLRNTRRATHPGGIWELGDAGSSLLDEYSFRITVPRREASPAWCSVDRSAPAAAVDLPFILHQASSGGPQWDAATHLDRSGNVAPPYRGYRLHANGREESGLRATPLVTLGTSDTAVTVAHRQFWERFPKAVEARPSALSLGLLPARDGSSHELQGGEQITEDFSVCFGPDDVCDTPLAWVREPASARVDVDWSCASEALPCLSAPGAHDPRYVGLIDLAVDGPRSFAAKRDEVDEYGWRHFGDLHADHERVQHAGPDLFVSHYNNQYDAVAGFARQFLRTGDRRWFDAMADLARHVIDIDIYHTAEDKAAYNGGLFWHTAHHTNAGRSTHRTYPKGGGASGGPSGEHNYTTGLTLYHCLTGDPRAREAVLGMAHWVIDMDDGALTPFRWLSRQPTGLASATGSVAYHGPGRGPGNGIVTLLNASRLTGDAAFLAKAEELIRRCVHPKDDIQSLTLLDAERRWYYTVFLQALGTYLDFKVEYGQIDGMYGYAQGVLLHYARWMARYEYPYLDKPEILEFPTETWAAQDIRKSDVFCYAARHARGGERTLFLERADFFFQSSVDTLGGMESRSFTRPIVLLLNNGYMRDYVRDRGLGTMPATDAPLPGHGAPIPFTPQKAIALRRLRLGAGALGLLLAAIVATLLVMWFA